MNNQEKQHAHQNTTAALNQKELFNLGFTRKMIKTLLPAPQLMQNPYFKNGAPMKVWNKLDVEVAMESDEFRKFDARPSYKYGIPISEANRFLYGKQKEIKCKNYGGI